LPPEAPKFDSYESWLKVTKPRYGESHVIHETQARTHRSMIFWDTNSRLWDQRADVLVTHEAPSVHPHGFAAIDVLAKAMGVQATFHGHPTTRSTIAASGTAPVSRRMAWGSAASPISTAASSDLGTSMNAERATEQRRLRRLWTMKRRSKFVQKSLR